MSKPEPLQPAEYSLAAEARLLRRLIDEAPAPSLKQNLCLALAKVLAQDEERSLRSNEMLTRAAVFSYTEAVFLIISQALAEELGGESDQFYRIIDRISGRLAAMPVPENRPGEVTKLLK